VGRVIASGEACRNVDLEDAACGPRESALAAAGVGSVCAFPVLVGDEVVAVAEFFASGGPEPDAMLVDALRHVGTQLGRVVERRRLQQEVVDAVWDQQRAFGQDLHDTVGQELTGICMLADSLARKLAKRDDPDAGAVRELAQMIQTAKQNTRRLAKGLLPVEIDAEGLKAALEELAENTRERCGIDVVVECDQQLQLEDNRIATHLFRIAQEAVTNAVRHASAGHLALRFTANDDDGVELSITDDGRGMPRPGRKRPRGVGLQIMRYRAQLIDAELIITPRKPSGTKVICRLSRSTCHVR
jgi:signal transduction histidine kinase